MSSNNQLFYVELIIIIGVIIFQFIHSWKVYSNIKVLRDIFIIKLVVKNGYIHRKFLLDPDPGLIIKEATPTEVVKSKSIVKISIIDTEGTNDIIKRIRDRINGYLLTNYGASVNFSIIKDLIDREVEAKDEEISQSIPTPLYLGLAATMLGIIFGLYAMPDINGSNFTEGINNLINGVKIAMAASLIGLFCTTLLSSFIYKRAIKISQQRKNLQLSDLQAKLLPELIKAEESGVSGLKSSLDRFAREATTIIETVHSTSVQTGINLKTQLDIIARVEQLDMTKVSMANMELFDRLESNIEAYEKFSEYLDSMKNISVNLKEFANRTGNINRVIDQISSSLSQSQELTIFLSSHFEKIEAAGEEARRAVNFADSHFKESVENLKEKTQASIDSLCRLTDTIESTLKEQFNKISEDLGDTTARHIVEFSAAYSQATPHFEQLNHLESLQPIQETLASKTDLMISNSEKSNEAILLKLNELIRKTSGGQNHQSSETMEAAIRELMKHLTGKDPNRIPKRMSWLRSVEPYLRVIAWGCIVIVCTGMILQYFRII